MSKSKTESENGFRVIKDGVMEPRAQKAKIQSRMFQFTKTKKKGRRK